MPPFSASACDASARSLLSKTDQARLDKSCQPGDFPGLHRDHQRHNPRRRACSTPQNSHLTRPGQTSPTNTHPHRKHHHDGTYRPQMFSALPISTPTSQDPNLRSHHPSKSRTTFPIPPSPTTRLPYFPHTRNAWISRCHENTQR